VRFRGILALNPLAVIINSYRNIFFYNTWPSWKGLGCVVLLAVVLIAGATQIFDRNREVFPEYL